MIYNTAIPADFTKSTSYRTLAAIAASCTWDPRPIERFAHHGRLQHSGLPRLNSEFTRVARSVSQSVLKITENPPENDNPLRSQALHMR